MRKPQQNTLDSRNLDANFWVTSLYQTRRRQFQEYSRVMHLLQYFADYLTKIFSTRNPYFKMYSLHNLGKVSTPKRKQIWSQLPNFCNPPWEYIKKVAKFLVGNWGHFGGNLWRTLCYRPKNGSGANGVPKNLMLVSLPPHVTFLCFFSFS